MATDLNRSLYRHKGGSVPNGAVVFVGRVFLVVLFLISAPSYFSAQGIKYAALQDVPLASLAVPLSGLIALAGSLSIVFGCRARLGAWLIVLFLIPVTFTMHKFWAYLVKKARSKIPGPLFILCRT